MTGPSKEFQAAVAQAFAAEATTVLRYGYFAQIARIEGHTAAADVFAELADSLVCAAHGHLDVLRDIADGEAGRPVAETGLNVASAVSTELREASDLYPRLAAAALDEGLSDVASWLTTLRALKQAHVGKLELVLGPGPAAAGTGEAG